jgi:uncharacterized membrane protein
VTCIRPCARLSTEDLVKYYHLFNFILMNQNSSRYPVVAFAIALIGMATQHFLFGEFITGRAPAWPESIPGKIGFAYITGFLFIVTGLALVFRKQARLFLLLTGFTILAWAGLRSIFELIMNPEYGGLLTSTMKALTLGSGAFIIGNTLQAGNDQFAPKVFPKLAPVGNVLLGLFFIVGGVQHFIFADFVKFLVPSWIPGQLFWTYFAGVALILAGISLITRIKIALSSLLGGIMVGIWVIVLHIPRAVEAGNQNEWTAVCEALAVSSLLLTIYFSEQGASQKTAFETLAYDTKQTNKNR